MQGEQHVGAAGNKDSSKELSSVISMRVAEPSVQTLSAEHYKLRTNTPQGMQRLVQESTAPSSTTAQTAVRRCSIPPRPPAADVVPQRQIRSSSEATSGWSWWHRTGPRPPTAPRCPVHVVLQDLQCAITQVSHGDLGTVSHLHIFPPLIP